MRRLLILVVLLAAVAIGAAAAYLSIRSTDGPLSGEGVSREVANRRPIAVMIDNFSPDARPQTGLSRASLVFETLAEGGITRFMAVFLEKDADTIGPVRSARLYFTSWASGLDAIYGHDGGSVDALQQLRAMPDVYDVDADRVSGPYWRSPERLAPHNEYTSTTKLRAYASAHGGSTTGTGMSIPHKRDALPFQRGGTSYLHIQFSYGDYNVTWQYDPGQNNYLRSMGGSPHIDAATHQQLRAKNVIVMFSESQPFEVYTPGAIHIRTEGTGKATVYQDGKAIPATWSKPSINAPLQWLNASGEPIELNRGQTWVEVVPTGNTVSVSSTP